MPPSCAILGRFAIGSRFALLWQHYGNAWQSPAVIRQAHRTPHACRTRTLRMPAKTPLAGDKIDAPAACVVPFRPYCGGVVTRNVSLEFSILCFRRSWILSRSLCLMTICRCWHSLGGVFMEVWTLWAFSDSSMWRRNGIRTSYPLWRSGTLVYHQLSIVILCKVSHFNGCLRILKRKFSNF